MRVKVIKNYFKDYYSLLQFEETFKKELEEWQEENLAQELHYTVISEVYVADTEVPYTLEYQFFLQGRYKYNLDYEQIKEHALTESKKIPVKVFVNNTTFKEILLKYLMENPDICPVKNTLLVNGVTFKLYIQ